MKRRDSLGKECPCRREDEDNMRTPTDMKMKSQVRSMKPLVRIKHRRSKVAQDNSPVLESDELFKQKDLRHSTRAYENENTYQDYVPLHEPHRGSSKPKKACMVRRLHKKTPNSSYIEEISPGVHEIIIDGLSGQLYVQLLKDAIEGYEFLFYKQGCNLMDDDDALRNKLIANLQMTRNMFRKDLDLWIACILYHPQMGRAHFEVLNFLKHKSNLWLFEYGQRDFPMETNEPFLKYTDQSTAGTPSVLFKKNSWLIYVATVIVLSITSVYIGFCDPNIFREFLINLAESVLAEKQF